MRGIGARLIHFSTDCVFSGRAGGYRETDPPDPVDLYGRSKLLGEVERAPGLTLRTSIIGLELQRNTGLIEWFLLSGARFAATAADLTGLTTIEMSRLVHRILERHADLGGIWHVASAPISKFRSAGQAGTRAGTHRRQIVPDDEFVCDRSLGSSAFADATGYQAPSWDDMLRELAHEILARDRARSA